MLAIRNPWNDLPFARFGGSSYDDLRSELNRVFSELERVGAPRSAGLRADFRDDGSEYVFEAELPGVTESDVDVQVTSGTFTITAERKAQAPEGYAAARQERGPYRLSRSYHIPDAVQPDKAEAHMKNGLLTVRLPKVPEASPRKLTVQAG